MKGEQAVLAFNRGLLSRLAMARVDLKRYPLSAEEMVNYVPRLLGSMMLRPGFGYLSPTKGNKLARNVPFVFSAVDTALLEFTDQSMRVRVNDELITRAAVTTAVTNGNFTTDLASWTDADESGAVSDWVTGGYLGLTGSGANAAIRTQVVNVGTSATLHALRVVITKGPVDIELTNVTPAVSLTLQTGVYSLAFTPTAGTFTISLKGRQAYQCLVDSINIEAAGALDIAAPWLEADLPYLRSAQSGDVIFVACNATYQQRRIERLGATSWAILLYQTNDGPFRAENGTTTTLTPSAISGAITVQSSLPVFKASHVGAIFNITSEGQTVNNAFTASNQNGDPIRITGVGSSRGFNISISGTFTGTITLQRSVGAIGAWVDTGTTYTGPVTTVFTDGLDNQIIFYRLITKAASFTSGTANASLFFAGGGITGVFRVTGFVDGQNVTADVITALGGTAATAIWAEGAWSDYRGYPSSVSFYEGRLWWAGKDKYYGSITDNFSSFDINFEGDAGPIIRSIGSGPVDVINWLLPLNRLMAGTDGNVVAGRSSSFDEPLTPTNFNPKELITQGAAKVAAEKLDQMGIFVQRGGYRLFAIGYAADQNDYVPEDLSMLVPDIGKPGIARIGIQRQADTRIHCVRADGKVALLVFDKTEDVKCWLVIETDGFIEDVAILPNATGSEDAVYYVVRRTINGNTVRYLERWATELQAIGGEENRIADSYLRYSGVATTTITGLTHLEGRSVVVWGWNSIAPFTDKDGNQIGLDMGTFTVTAGQISGLPKAVTSATVGLAYESRWRGTKLAFVTDPGEVGLNERKRVNALGLVMADTHARGLTYGKNFTTMFDLPSLENYKPVDPDSIWTDYDKDSFAFDGEWNNDERVCIKSMAPRPCTLLALTATMNVGKK